MADPPNGNDTYPQIRLLKKLDKTTPQCTFALRKSQNPFKPKPALSLFAPISMSPFEPQLPKPQPEQQQEDESSKPQSKKATKKEVAKLDKLKHRQEAAVASDVQSLSMEDLLVDNYHDVPILDLQSKVTPGTRVWTEIDKLAEPMKDQYVLVQGRVQRICAKGKTAFMVLRERGFTVQCLK